MMKQLICILLMLVFALPALAEEALPFAPYDLTAPEGVVLNDNEGVYTFVRDNSRVVVQYISRVPDEAPTEALIRLMGQFDPAAVIGDDLPVMEGCVGLNATHTDCFGEGVDMRIVMVLSAEGDLLIFSAYDMAGDSETAASLLDELLMALTLNGEGVLQAETIEAP